MGIVHENCTHFVYVQRVLKLQFQEFFYNLTWTLLKNIEVNVVDIFHKLKNEAIASLQIFKCTGNLNLLIW